MKDIGGIESAILDSELASNTARGGLALLDAIFNAGRRRLDPILMTPLGPRKLLVV